MVVTVTSEHTIERLNELTLWEIIHEAASIVDADDGPRAPLRVCVVDGPLKRQAEDALKALDYDSHCELVPEQADAHVVLEVVGEPYLQCSHTSKASDLSAVGFTWYCDVRVLVLGQTCTKLLEIYPARCVDEGADFYDYLGQQLVTAATVKGITRPSVAELYVLSLAMPWAKVLLDDNDRPGLTRVMRDAICSKAKRLMSGAHKEPAKTPTESTVASAGWAGLRTMLCDLLKQRGVEERDALICAWFCVPPQSGISKLDLKQYLEDNSIIPHMMPPSFNVVPKRKLSRLSPSDLGEIGESWVFSLLTGHPEKSIEQTDKSQRRIDLYRPPDVTQGHVDIGDAESCLPSECRFALNVKLSLEDGYVNRVYECSPEHLVKTAYAVLVMPRTLTISLFHITGEAMTINNRTNGIYASPERLNDVVQSLARGETVD